ncbi:MAG TPA: SurA N-terminal domain-containing protein [Prolixibacteraceae bacterium]|nr:SurA N-terminal domain-containing protein [Prolixibacteraceae bacterium]
MATLQNIRNRGGLMVAIVIGLALGAFILGDMLNSGSKLMTPSQMKIAEIDGESIQYPDFQRKVEELSEIYKMNTQQAQIDEATWEQIREQVWQSYLLENTVTKASEDLGLSVSADELFDLVQGSNPHPIVQQLFQNPQTGQVDKSTIINFLKNLETNATPQQKAYWLYIENQIRQDRLRTKYNNLIAKGLYITSQEAKKSLEARNQNATFQFIALSYASVPDADVKISDAELKEYYNAHKDEYEQDNTRKIEYITFDVLPSSADNAATQKWVNDNKNDFAAAQDNQQYINANSDQRFDPSFYKKEELSPAIAEWAFAAQPGEVYGPYFENNAYKLAKLDQVKMLPDSVQASHILISPQSTGSVAKAQALADSIKTLLENGSDFGVLARQFSEDKGSAAMGGDLGWFKRRQMVPEFEQAAFSGEVNKVNTAITQYGIHLIKTTKKGTPTNQVRVAILARNVEASSETYQRTYADASKFASENASVENFNKSVLEQKMDKKLATVKEADREVPGLESSRQLVRAAFQTEKGEIMVNSEGSTIFEFGNKFLIGVVTDATEKGSSTFEEAKERVELAVRKEKKAEILAEKLKNAASGQSTLEAVASKVSAEVKEASGLNFETYSIPAAGFEPAVVGTVSSLAENKISEPIEGINGVYLARVVAITRTSDSNVDGEKQRLAQNLGYRAGSQVFESLKKLVDIEDKRSKFY